MTVYLSSNVARQIAESQWGAGGTNAYRTNRRGAFYYSCAGHGGFVIDAGALTGTERELIAPYVSPDQGTAYVNNGKVELIMHPWRKRSGKASFSAQAIPFDIILLEEDCAWSIAYVLTGIRRHGDRDSTMLYAKQCFDRWIAPKP